SDYYYFNGNIYHYSLENNEEDTKKFLSEGEHMKDFAACNDTIYYVVKQMVGRDTEWAVKRLEYKSGRVKTFLPWDRLFLLYNGGEDQEISLVRVEIYEDNLLIEINNRYSTQVYICPTDDSMNPELTDVNDLFPEENGLEVVEKILYKGIIIERQYDEERGKYTIIGVRDEESGRRIFSDYYEACLKVDGEDVYIWKEDSEFWYCEEGSSMKHNISCLSGNEYENTLIFERKLTVENGEIIGLIHTVRDYRSQPDYPNQGDLRYDVLFRLNPKTGENSILYKPENNRTRIIGYQDSIIYLMEKYKIYSQSVEDGEERILLYELPEHTDYRFDWQGGHLLIFYDDFERYELVTDLQIKQDGN
ncbi:MAG: hypothetical protein K2O73_04975, partial [Lachnospiraceae bacterium]|nr:hypothetical protein [Lachnospiraceae bacterium]